MPPPAAPPRVLRSELAVVLLLAFAPAMLGLLVMALGVDTGEPATRVGPAVGTMAFQLFLAWMPVVVIAFALMRNGERAATIGLGRFDRAADGGVGLGLWVASWVLVFVLSILFRPLGGREVDFLPPALPLWFRVADALVIALTAGVTEEVVVRGYAQTRLQQLRVPTPLVVLLPTGLWGMLHLYEGVGGALTIFCLGLMYALFFLRTRRLWPLIIAHSLFDLTQLALLLATRH